MSEGTSRRSAIVLAAISIAVFCYIFVFAEPLYPELNAQARWYVDLDQAATPMGVESSDERLLSFSLGERYGYLRPDGRLVSLAGGAGAEPGRTGARVAIADEAFAAPVSTAARGGFVLRTPSGETLRALEGASRPFFHAGMLFSAEADGTGVLAYDPQGTRLWSYRFPCHLSAFGAGAGLAVGGTVDGWLEGVRSDGSRAFAFAPGGSRLQVVLGLGVSPSGKYVAAVTGIDRQRLVVLGQGGADYRVTSHRYLESDYREPVRVVVLKDDRHVLYRRADGIGVRTIDGKVDEVLPVKADDFDVALDERSGIAYVAARRAKRTEVAAFRLPATLLGVVSLPDDCEFIRLDGSSIYFGRASAIGRFDFLEE